MSNKTSMRRDESVRLDRLERDSVVPMYLQIAEKIEAQIEAGLLQPGERLESEHKLCARLAVSRITIRLAIQELAQKGLIEKRQGKGTFVTRRYIRHDASSLNRLRDTLFAQGHNPATRVLTFQLAKPPPRVATAFEIERVELVRFDRLYLLGGRPVGLVQGWLLPEARVVTRDQAELHSTAWLFSNVLHFNLGKTELLIRAGVAPRDVAEHLDIRKGSPVLVLSRQRFLADGRLAEDSVFTMTATSYEFRIDDSERLPRIAELQMLAA
jgi:GntR family transcriptional regulator